MLMPYETQLADERFVHCEDFSLADDLQLAARVGR